MASITPFTRMGISTSTPQATSDRPVPDTVFSENGLCEPGHDFLALTAQLAAWMVLPKTRHLARPLLQPSDDRLAKACHDFLTNKCQPMPIDLHRRSNRFEMYFPDVLSDGSPSSTKAGDIMNGGVMSEDSRRRTIEAALRHWHKTYEKVEVLWANDPPCQLDRDPWVALAEVLTLIQVTPDPSPQLAISPTKLVEEEEEVKRRRLPLKRPMTPMSSNDSSDHQSRNSKKQRTTGSPVLESTCVERFLTAESPIGGQAQEHASRLTQTPVRILHHMPDRASGDVLHVPGLHDPASIQHPAFSLVGASTVASITPDMEGIDILTTRERLKQEKHRNLKIIRLQSQLDMAIKQRDRHLRLLRVAEKGRIDDKAEADRKIEKIREEAEKTTEKTKIYSLQKQDKLSGENEELRSQFKEKLMAMAKEF